jgi:hypothetical protein
MPLALGRFSAVNFLSLSAEKDPIQGNALNRDRSFFRLELIVRHTR